ncbi:uncharacterized protein LOC101711025 isoform X1 [Heterocephalus glaber]|uniref:Uncharacterized protein LOC101711025 isoform X1 n=1 Tax=Heterocephalus glaber TaxID=10181 RepID=A0AAX6QX98_HETGA|nr:uncharacterized protein LOC101711025 isoform X1 [Heterocephalus glaber]
MLLTWPRAHEALPSPNPLGKGGAGAASPPPTPLRFRGGGLTPRIASSPRTLPRATRESPPEISRIQISAAEASPLSSTAPCGHTLGDAHATPPGALPRRPERRRTARLAPCSEPGRISRISLERKARRCRGLWGHGACTPSSLLSLESREHSATNWLRETASGRSLAGLCGTLLPGDRRLENELCDVIDSADQWKKLPRRGVPPLSTWPPHARERASARGGGGENL